MFTSKQAKREIAQKQQRAEKAEAEIEMLRKEIEELRAGKNN